jgi:putative DNA primase/helicase
VTPDPAPWPEPVDGDKLLDEILIQARRYVAWPEGGAEAFALWVLFTHVFDCFDIAPYLAFISPTPECGKTTSFKLLSRLVPRALISSSTSGAVIPRLIEQIQPTLLADELDTHSEEKADLWGVLNSGHDREGANYTRCAGADKDEARVYSTWCPKALAKIKKLTPQLISRSIVIHMKRRAPSEKIEKLRSSRRTPHLVELKQKAMRWAADNADALRDAGDPEMPEALINRRADNWEPLFVVADACGGDWSERARQVAALLSGAEDATLAVELLEDIKKIHDEHPANAHASKDLVAWLGAMEDRPWAEYRRGNEITQAQLAELLKPFGIKPGTVRLGAGTIKGYYVTAFADAFKRYLAPEPPL